MFAHLQTRYVLGFCFFYEYYYSKSSRFSFLRFGYGCFSSPHFAHYASAQSAQYVTEQSRKVRPYLKSAEYYQGRGRPAYSFVSQSGLAAGRQYQVLSLFCQTKSLTCFGGWGLYFLREESMICELPSGAAFYRKIWKNSVKYLWISLIIKSLFTIYSV